jgi:23S rRNA (adenine2030-N6)-methyltransferase
MNYRHIYHAGNICDVVKHTALTLLLDQLRAKAAPFCILDTHAGAGLYNLRDARAMKTNEAQDGVLKLLTAPDLSEIAVYIDILRGLNPDWRGGKIENFRLYPGSPLLACRLLRPEDRLIACELHEEDAAELKRNLSQYPQAQIHKRDGYEALRAFLPPPEKRGLVLIDPPYEEVNEFTKLLDAVADAYKRWAQGVFMIWYPVKDRPAIWQFHEKLIETGIKKILCAEFIYEEELSADRLNGCGLIIVNPPWKTDEKLKNLFPALHKAMGTKHEDSEIKWLADER